MWITATVRRQGAAQSEGCLKLFCKEGDFPLKIMLVFLNEVLLRAESTYRSFLKKWRTQRRLACLGLYDFAWHLFSRAVFILKNGRLVRDKSKKERVYHGYTREEVYHGRHTSHAFPSRCVHFSHRHGARRWRSPPKTEFC